MSQFSGSKSISTNKSWQSLTKVPKITAYFWIIKILTTAMGEATSDFMVSKYNPYLAVFAGFIIFAILLIFQFRAKKYIPYVYWLAAVGVSIFGTMAADVLHIQLHVPYVASTIFYNVILFIIFSWWYKSEHTLSFHSIHTKKREAFYWLAVLATFALGTALGDFTASTLGLGYLTSGILFTVLFFIPAIGYWRFNLNPIFAFWASYVLTRPLGASFADWLSKPKASGGLGYGDGHVSLVLSIAIFMFVSYITMAKIDSQSLEKSS